MSITHVLLHCGYHPATLDGKKKLLKSIARLRRSAQPVFLGKEFENLEAAIRANAAFIRNLRILATSIREHAATDNKLYRDSHNFPFDLDPTTKAACKIKPTESF
jgi:hypothetical protein